MNTEEKANELYPNNKTFCGGVAQIARDAFAALIDKVSGRDIEKGAEVMPLREPLFLRETDHGVIAQECTNKGRALF